MAVSQEQSKKLQWKWVGITFLLYVVFYLLPIWVAAPGAIDNNVGKLAAMFIGGWSFGGVIIIAAISGYLSKGVTILGAAIVGAGAVALWFIAFRIFLAPPMRFSVGANIVPIVIAMIVVFLLSLVGAWLGERAQKLWKAKAPEST